MAKLIRNVTVVDLKNDSVESVFEDKGKRKKKVTTWLRPAERLVRNTLKAEEKCWANALTRHDKSRSKKRDRWLSDSFTNGLKALHKGFRAFRI